MRRVIIESPYAGDIAANIEYARLCLRHSILLGEAPLASHLLYTQNGVLKDDDLRERDLGISIGLIWAECADLTAVYIDYGISKGMQQGIAHAQKARRPIEYRRLTDR